MKNRFDECIRFKNGNINVRFFQENIDDLKTGKFSEIELLSFALENVDTYFIGEPYCIGNYECAMLLYNVYNDCIYELRSGELDKLVEGKTLKLIANFHIDDETRELIENY